ncbi:DeoR/GlpR transcriptional regulator [Rhodobacteraceae bacterium CCMM004]|nr:DeoR/GlpR transcriptional regulator [Rhodobacteraceae bacterium CCMM004]
MLPPMRRARILELLRRDKVATLKDMSIALGVSMSTLRRDVDYLCESGHLERTHGGAMLNEEGRSAVELEPAIATELESDAKRAIGRRAAELIKPGQTVMFDSGSTTAAVARAARERGVPFTAVTNDLAIGGLLSATPTIRVLVVGGFVRTGTSTLLGPELMTAVARLRTDLVFIGTHALTADELSDTSVELADLKRAFLLAADRAVAVVDSSKVFSRAFCSFARTRDLERVITDARIAPGDLDALRARVAVDTVSEVE